MSCPNCESHKSTPYYLVPGKSQYQIVKCNDCSLLYLQSMPSESELAAYYNSSEYFDGDDSGYQLNYLQQRESIERDSNRRLDLIESILNAHDISPPGNKQRRVLDIGCAAGFFLNSAKQRKWAIDGVELSTEMASYANNLLGIGIKSAFNLGDYEPGSFDAICMWEVIEHLRMPNAMLRDIRGLLKSSGVLAISTPNTNHWQARFNPEWWSEFKPPAHLIYYTEETLNDTLSRCGYKHTRFQKTRPNNLLPDVMTNLHKVRDVIGDGANRKTPLWPVTSAIYRVSSKIVGRKHHHDDSFVGLESYSQP